MFLLTMCLMEKPQINQPTAPLESTGHDNAVFTTADEVQMNKIGNELANGKITMKLNKEDSRL